MLQLSSSPILPLKDVHRKTNIFLSLSYHLAFYIYVKYVFKFKDNLNRRFIYNPNFRNQFINHLCGDTNISMNIQ